MPKVTNIEEAKEVARFIVANPTYETIVVDEDGSMYINRDPKTLEGKIFQVKPEVKEEPVKSKPKKTNE